MKNPVSGRSEKQANVNLAEEATRRLLQSVDREARRVLDTLEPEGVHQLRVAIRRFREAGPLAEDCLGRVAARRFRRQLKDILAAAGPVRNCDIARELIARETAGRLGDWEPLLAREQSAARGHLNTLVKRWLQRKDARRSPARGGDIRNGLGEDAGRVARERLARMAARVLKRGRKAARGQAPANKLHRLRIAAKRLRYALEVQAPMAGDGASTFIEQLKRVQGWLGEANDCRTVARMAEDWPDSAELKKALKARSRRNVEAFLAHWRRYFGDKTKRAQWLERVAGHGRQGASGTGPA